MSAPPSLPSPPVLMDHQPFAALPDALALHSRAAVMFIRGEYASALPLAEQVLVLSQSAHAASPSPQTILDVVVAMCELGKTKRNLGDLPGAHTVLQQTVALAEQPPVGPVHPRLAQAMRELGRVLQDRGRYDEADATLQRTLTMQEQMLGPNHDDVSATLTHMGESCFAQGNYRRAKKVLIRAVAIAELHVVPEKYPDTFISALHVLCCVYLRLEEYGRAQPIAERQLAIEEQFLGPYHPQVGVALQNVAACLKGQGKLSEVLSMFERVLAIVERVYGPNHIQVATSLSNLGVLYLEQGDHRRAQGVLERALTIQERALGPQHLEVAVILSNLASGCHMAGDLAQAKTLFERALAIYDTQLGRTHPQTAEILASLATLATATGRPRQAAALTERAAVAAVVAEHQPCGWCGRMAVHRAKFCGRCKMVWYCNEECQHAAWREHRPHCHAKPEAPAAASAASSASSVLTAASAAK
jgi:tetratricopeptide (TPR) repeat protein